MAELRRLTEPLAKPSSDNDVGRRRAHRGSSDSWRNDQRNDRRPPVGRRSARPGHQATDTAGQGDDPAWLGRLGAERRLGLVLQPLVGFGLGDGAVAGLI
jgi:hypothetical protein